MTEEEKVFHCGHISLAAKSLGIMIKEFKNEAGAYFFQWLDPQAKVSIRGEANASKQEAFFNSCQTLVKYLDVKS